MKSDCVFEGPAYSDFILPHLCFIPPHQHRISTSKFRAPLQLQFGIILCQSVCPKKVECLLTSGHPHQTQTAMSFGFGIGDFVALSSLALKIHDRFRDSCGEYEAIATEYVSYMFQTWRLSY